MTESSHQNIFSVPIQVEKAAEASPNKEVNEKPVSAANRDGETEPKKKEEPATAKAKTSQAPAQEEMTPPASGNGHDEGGNEGREANNNEQPEPREERPTKDQIEEALQAMLNMGFTDEGGWLTKLLKTKQGNVGQALNVLQPNN